MNLISESQGIREFSLNLKDYGFCWPDDLKDGVATIVDFTPDYWVYPYTLLHLRAKKDGVEIDSPLKLDYFRFHVNVTETLNKFVPMMLEKLEAFGAKTAGCH